MKLITIRNSQRTIDLPANQIEALRDTASAEDRARRIYKGVVVMKSGREYLTTDLPFVRAQLDAIPETPYDPLAEKSLFERIFG